MASAHDRYVLSKYRHANRMESFIAWNERIKLIGIFHINSFLDSPA